MWDVKDSERLNKEYVESAKAKIQQQLLLGNRILSLHNMVGYRDYVETLKKIREQALRGLVSCSQSNEEMRVVQGRCQALEDIVSLLDNTKVRMSGLKEQLERLEKDWQSLSKGKKS